MTLTKAPQAFPRSEYLRRLKAIKERMSDRGAEVAIVTAPANITYLSGYTSKSAYVAQGLIVIHDEDEPYFFTRRQDAAAAKHQMFIDAARVNGYAEALVGNSEADGFDAIIDFLKEAGHGSSVVALEKSVLPAQTIAKFRSKLPNGSVADFSKEVDWTRLVKSDLEITAMRDAAAITDAAMLRASEIIRPGVHEAEAAAEIIATLVRGTPGNPGTDLASFFLCASPRIGTPHIQWSDDVFRAGSQVNLEFGGVRHGYTAGLMRTLSIGDPSDRLHRLHEAEVAGMEAALAVVKPGTTCGEVATAFKTTLRSYGFDKDSRCGYPIGIDWLEPTASIAENDTTVLEANMTFHLMLGNWIDDDFGYVLSETFRVTETGAEGLTTLPRDLFIV